MATWFKLKIRGAILGESLQENKAAEQREHTWTILFLLNAKMDTLMFNSAIITTIYSYTNAASE